jgi:uncharacterized repeat protein (TIGR02543 family)
MKSKFFFMGIIGIVLMFGLFIAGCGGGGGPDGGTTYTVTFDTNGGGGSAPAPQSVTEGGSITLPAGSSLYRDGHTFIGWNTNRSGNGENFSAGASYTPYGNITLFAQWLEGEYYTVTFNANGGSGTAPSAQFAESGTSITLPSGSGLTRSGFTFGGWEDSSGTTYSAGTPFTPNGNITLYAKWLSSGNGSYSSPYSLVENIWSESSIHSYDSEIYYTFNTTPGTTYYLWWNDYDGDGTKTADIYVYVTDDYGDYAVELGMGDNGWDYPISFTVDGSLKISVTLYNYSGTYAIGYTTNDSRPGNAFYTVSFDANGGTGTVPNPQTAMFGSYITLPFGSGLTYSGYTFAGWDDYSSGNTYNAGSYYTVNGDVTLYANWAEEAASYTVTFNANGGSGTVPNPQTAVSGSYITLPPGSGLTKSGYAFVGWDDYSGITYNAGSYYWVDGDVTLYAVWLPSYTVTFMSRGTQYEVQTVAEGEYATQPTTNPTRDAHTFEAWYSDEYLTTTYYFYDPVYGDLILYAGWYPRNLTVNFNPDAAPTLTKPIIHLNPENGPTTATLEVENPGRYSSIQWKILGQRETDSSYTLFGDEYYYEFNGWGTPRYFTAEKNGTLLLRVHPYMGYSDYAGTFGIVYDTSDTRPVIPAPTPPVQGGSDSWTAGTLVDGQWADDNITGGTTQHWYQFDVTYGTTYRVWWDDGYHTGGSSGNKTLDVVVSARYSDGTPIFSDVDSGYNAARSFIANQDGTVYVIVTPYSSGSTGTYGVVFSSTSSTRPSFDFGDGGSSDTTAFTLVNGQWVDASITTGNGERWYKIDVIAGTTYYIWWNNSSYGDESKTGDVHVQAIISYRGEPVPGTYVIVNSSALTLDSSDYTYNTVGEHVLTVEVTLNGVPYSRTINFTVAE